MTVVAVTGHMDLTEQTTDLVRAALNDRLRRFPASELVGISCIARGADTLFAEVIVELGGSLVVVQPSQDYREAKVKPDHAPAFDRLKQTATEVVVLPYATASRDAYEAANQELLRRADMLLAVWDGKPSNGKGGTADTVNEARAAGLAVDVVWPPGAARKGQ